MKTSITDCGKPAQPARENANSPILTRSSGISSPATPDVRFVFKPAMYMVDIVLCQEHKLPGTVEALCSGRRDNADKTRFYLLHQPVQGLREVNG